MNTELLPPHIARLVHFYEHLAPADLDRLGEIYTAQASFKDPFNDVRGLPAIRAVFAHMFAALQDPRFEVLHVAGQDCRCALVWRFRFGLRGRALEVEGATWLDFDTDGRVLRHRDYWDAAEELYAKLPLLGVLMRWLQRKLATPLPRG